jgi:hypothetical protein
MNDDENSLFNLIHDQEFSASVKEFAWSFLASSLYVTYGESNSIILKESIDGLWLPFSAHS